MAGRPARRVHACVAAPATRSRVHPTCPLSPFAAALPTPTQPHAAQHPSTQAHTCTALASSPTSRRVTKNFCPAAAAASEASTAAATARSLLAAAAFFCSSRISRVSPCRASASAALRTVGMTAPAVCVCVCVCVCV